MLDLSGTISSRSGTIIPFQNGKGFTSLELFMASKRSEKCSWIFFGGNDFFSTTIANFGDMVEAFNIYLEHNTRKIINHLRAI